MKARRWVRIAIAAPLVILLLPALYVEVAPAPRLTGARPLPEPLSGVYRVYVADWGHHTSIILQQPPVWRLGPLGRETTAFVEYAWGDRRFYMESNFRPDALFATLFLPTETVAYVDSWSADPARTARPRALYARKVDAARLRILATALEDAIRRNPTRNRASAYPPVSGYDGRFYPARGDYLWWNDCNRWTVERLAAAHLARGGRGVIFSGQVAHHLIGFHRVFPNS